jgi:ankyrin repeat protein
MTTSSSQDAFSSDPHDRNVLLCQAAAAGNVEEVRRLLALGCNASGHFDAARAAERYAPIRRLVPPPNPIADVPADIQAKVNERMAEYERETFQQLSGAPSSREIPLFAAVEAGCLDCISALLAAGANPAVRDNLGVNALSRARTPEIAKTLVRAGTPLELTEAEAASSSRCTSPLDDAISSGCEGLEVARAVIAAGANVNATLDHGYTLFMSAVGSSRHPEMLRLLIASGANPHAVSEYGYNAWHAAIDVNFEANAEESVRDTFGYLKELGVNIEQRNKGGQTPLARAISEGTGLEVRVLCEMGADPNAVCTLRTCGGDECTSRELPLIFHVVEGHGVQSDVKLEAILDAGADSHALVDNRWTPLCYVVSALAASSDDSDATYERFYEEVKGFRVTSPGPGFTRADFVTSVMPSCRAFVETFAATLNPPSGSEYAGAWRAEEVNMATLLLADACWKRYSGRASAT